MEIVVLSVVGNEDEHLLAGHGGVLQGLKTPSSSPTRGKSIDFGQAVFEFLLPDDVLEMACIVLHLWRTHHIALEIVGVSTGLIVHLAHDDIVRKSCYDGVRAGETVGANIRNLVLAVRCIGESERNATLGVERIELSNGTMDDLGKTSVKTDAVIEGIGNLTTNDSDDAMSGLQTVALAVMDCAVLDVELQFVDSGRITDYTVVGRMEVSERQLVAHG